MIYHELKYSSAPTPKFKDKFLLMTPHNMDSIMQHSKSPT
jgi:hypothetical protein